MKMDNFIQCQEGIAYICLYPGNFKPMIMGSLVNSNYWELPTRYQLLKIEDYRETIKPIQDEEFNPDWCQLKVDILSENSICLRLFEVDSEESPVPFTIQSRQLFEIAKGCLKD